MRVRDEDFQRQQTDRHERQLSSLLTESLVMTSKDEKQIPRCVFAPRNDSTSSTRGRQAVASARICFCMAKHSSTSPTLMSLKFETPTPHSKPARTSLASSLNRRSELTRPV